MICQTSELSKINGSTLSSEPVAHQQTDNLLSKITDCISAALTRWPEEIDAVASKDECQLFTFLKIQSQPKKNKTVNLDIARKMKEELEKTKEVSMSSFSNKVEPISFFLSRKITTIQNFLENFSSFVDDTKGKVKDQLLKFDSSLLLQSQIRFQAQLCRVVNDGKEVKSYKVDQYLRNGESQTFQVSNDVETAGKINENLILTLRRDFPNLPQLDSVAFPIAPIV